MLMKRSGNGAGVSVEEGSGQFEPSAASARPARDLVSIPPDPAASADPHVRTSLALLQGLLGDYPDRDFNVRFWDGSVWASAPGVRPRFTLVLNHPGALRQMLAGGNEEALGEAFIYGDCDMEGDLEPAFRAGDYLLSRRRSLLARLQAARQIRMLPADGRPRGGFQAAALGGRTHSRRRDRDAVTYHYDLSNEFFALWLDRAMVYSCAYFTDPAEDIDTAQARKLDYLCRKLRLRPGERLLDIGCGWGGLILHAARHYGVRTTGITLSERQAELARARIHDAGLDAQCRVEVRDYRDLPPDTLYDRIVSVGMVEHVGAARLPSFCAHAWRVLRPGGTFLLHGVSTSQKALSRRGPFARNYVFPDTELVSIATTLAAAEQAGFEVRDVESLREHYDLTLRSWVRQLEARWTEARAMVGETACRVWRLFMAGAAYRFAVNDYSLYQTLLVKPGGGASRIPLTRADWYAPQART